MLTVRYRFGLISTVNCVVWAWSGDVPAEHTEDEMARHLKITIDTGFFGATHEDECELPDNWDSLSPAEQNVLMLEACENAINNYIEASAEVIES